MVRETRSSPAGELQALQEGLLEYSIGRASRVLGCCTSSCLSVRLALVTIVTRATHKEASPPDTQYFGRGRKEVLSEDTSTKHVTDCMQRGATANARPSCPSRDDSLSADSPEQQLHLFLSQATTFRYHSELSRTLANNNEYADATRIPNIACFGAWHASALRPGGAVSGAAARAVRGGVLVFAPPPCNGRYRVRRGGAQGGGGRRVRKGGA